MALKVNTVPRDQLDSIVRQLGELRRVDLSCYKRSTLGRRVEQRMRACRCLTTAEYSALLLREPAEVDALLSTLFVKLTGFFRDPPMWEALRQSVLPKLAAQTGPGGEIRVWSVGCASGEEAYSIAMLLSELGGARDFSFKVFATDRDSDAIMAAGRGRFSPEQVHTLAPAVRERWFERTVDGYVTRRELRRSIIFGVQDLVTDAPISRLDLILCRNLFIYLDAAGQRRCLMHLHQGLKPQGVVVLGKSELLLAAEGLFAPVDLNLRIYRKCAAAPLDVVPSLTRKGASAATTSAHQSSGGVSAQTYSATLDAVDCAVVVVSKDGSVIFWNYEAERLYGKTASEVVGQPIGRLKLEGITGQRLLERASAGPYAESRADEVFRAHDGTSRTLRLKVRPFTVNQDEESGLICVAIDVSELHGAVESLRLTQQRHEQANVKSRATIAQLRSSNEELTAINEALRSANQELHTINEELQSTNEELEAINEELQLTRAEFEAARAQPGPSQTEMSLAKALQEAAMHSGALAVLGVDERGRINLCNPGAARLLNHREDQLLRRSLQRLSLAPLPEPVCRRIKRSIGHKLPLHIEAFDCVIDAQHMKLSCRLAPLTNNGEWSALLIIEPAHGPAASAVALTRKA